MARIRALGVVAGCALVVALTGCAILVGSPDGHRLSEAGADLDAGGGPNHDADHDSGHAHDAKSARDAGMSDAKHAVDAPPPGFCASLIPPTGALFVCDDFDDDPDATALGSPGMELGGSLAVESMVFKSAPRALLVTVNPPDGGSSSAYLSRSIGTGTTLTLACDMRIEALAPSTGSTHLMSLTFSSGKASASVTVFAKQGLDGGAAGFGVQESDPTPDSGETYPSHPEVALSASGWMHLVLTVEGTPGHYYDSLEIDGQVLEKNYPLAAAFVGGSPVAQLGMNYVTGSALREIYFDDVVLMSQ